MYVPARSFPGKKSGVGGFHLLSPTEVEEGLCWVNTYWSRPSSLFSVAPAWHPYLSATSPLGCILKILYIGHISPCSVSSKEKLETGSFSQSCSAEPRGGLWQVSATYVPTGLNTAGFPVPQDAIIYMFLIGTHCLCIVEPMSPWGKEGLSGTSYSSILLTGKLLFSDYLIFFVIYFPK